ncbi:hypothetical protein ACAG96_03935 [Candidatus Izemoplasma sp. B36]|uniref:hypothetical protein n=1 Tax=Candidatus Izemoplasma sp. B36 TaxID=3242468 RepID=UPI003558FD8F
MKSLKTKVIMSAFVLLFALVATIGSTYAWFTVSNQVSVQAIDLDVVTADSLLIQVQDEVTDTESAGVELGNAPYTTYGLTNLTDFQTNLTTTEIALATQYTTYTGYKMAPLTAAYISTVGTTTAYDEIDMDKLAYLTDLETTTDRALTEVVGNPTYKNGTVGGYVEFNFWLIYSGLSESVDIALQDLVITETGASPSAVTNAISVGIKGDQVETTPTENIFSLNPDYGFLFESTDAGYSETSALNSISDKATLIGKHSVYFNTADTDDLANIYVGTTGTSSQASTVATLAPNTPELITVRIWLEGWDSQTTNLLSSATFNISFEFVIKAV